MMTAIPIAAWDETEDQRIRRHGKHGPNCGSADVAALLGFDRYRSPWTVWADKTGHPLYHPDRTESPAMALGIALEPWLREQAGPLIHPERECVAERPAYRVYAHPEHDWRVAAPDGWVRYTSPWEQRDGYKVVVYPGLDGSGPELIETKTAGLISGRTRGWSDDAVPLYYDLQCRWQMHVMSSPVCHLVGLVVGRGLVHYPIVRDMEVEADLVEQVSAWWERHIVGGDEPPLGGRDAAVVAALYPRVQRKTVDLDDTDALDLWRTYRDARDQEKEAAARKDEAGIALKALIGDAHEARVDGRPIATWGERKGRVDWEAIARELYQLLTTDAPYEVPKIEDLADQRRGPTSRALTIKE